LRTGWLEEYLDRRKDEVTGDSRKQHNEELHNLHSSLNIIRLMKSRRMGCVGDVARMGAKRNAYRKLMGKPKRKEDQDVGEWIILKWILER
jgi:hypothetical protein